MAEASGTVHESSLFYDLQIYGMFQKCHGPTLPPMKDIVEWYCDYDEDGRHRLSAICPSILHFRGRLARETAPFVVRFDDWTIAPTTGKCHIDGTIPRWQFWRMHRGIWFPSPFLVDEQLEFGYQDGAMCTILNGTVIGKWSDWTYALGEKLLDNVPPFSGQHLFIDRNIIQRFAADTGSTFCWICELTCYYRNQHYGEFKTFKDYMALGASSVIRP